MPKAEEKDFLMEVLRKIFLEELDKEDLPKDNKEKAAERILKRIRPKKRKKDVRVVQAGLTPA